MTTSVIINIILGIVAVLISFVSYYFYIKGVLQKAANDAINDAEHDGTTGEEKLDLATSTVYALIPKFMRSIITKTFVKGLVQSAFDKIDAYAKQQIDKDKKTD